jgi:hypothetical protein
MCLKNEILSINNQTIFYTKLFIIFLRKKLNDGEIL